MKKLSTLLSSIAVICFFTLNAYAQDTAIARIDNNAILKKVNPPTTESMNASKTSESSTEEVAPSTKFVVPEVRDRNSKGSILDRKVGPNGEDVFMDKSGYYYHDATGKKVRAAVNELKDKPKHS
jgi:hypothetical protein